MKIAVILVWMALAAIHVLVAEGQRGGSWVTRSELNELVQKQAQMQAQMQAQQARTQAKIAKMTNDMEKMRLENSAMSKMLADLTRLVQKKGERGPSSGRLDKELVSDFTLTGRDAQQDPDGKYIYGLQLNLTGTVLKQSKASDIAACSARCKKLMYCAGAQFEQSNESCWISSGEFVYGAENENFDAFIEPRVYAMALKKKFEDTVVALSSRIDDVQDDIKITNANLQKMDEELTTKIDDVNEELTKKIIDVDGTLTTKINNAQEELTKKIIDVDGTLTTKINNAQDDIKAINNTVNDIKACQMGFTGVLSTGSCYRVEHTKYNWAAAQENCRNLDSRAHLVVINNAREMEVLKSLLTNDGISTILDAQLWTAGHRTTGTVFVWQPNSDRGGANLPMSYTNWESGQPDNAGRGEDCMTINVRWGMRWNDQTCSDPEYSVCEIELNA